MPPVTLARVPAIEDHAFLLADSVQSLLSGVLDLTVSPSHGVFLSDRSLPFVLQLDSTGALRQILGREGRGPGEFVRPASMGWRGDSLWVEDWGLMRVTLFDTVGAGFSSFSVLFPQRPSAFGRRRYASGNAQPVALLPDGDLLVYQAPNQPETGRPASMAILRVSRDYVLRDTVSYGVTPHLAMSFLFAQGSAMLSQPFSDDPLFRVSPDGRWFARVDRLAGERETGSYRVTLKEYGSRVVYQRDFRYSGLPLTDDTVETYIRNTLHPDAFPGQVRAPITRDSLESQLFRPRYYPPVADARVGRDGVVWLRVVAGGTGADLRQGEAEWVALSQHGFELYRVVTPSRLRVYSADRRSLWGVEYDDDGIPAVRHYLVPEQGAIGQATN
jgi:hypothetical protein